MTSCPFPYLIPSNIDDENGDMNWVVVPKLSFIQFLGGLFELLEY